MHEEALYWFRRTTLSLGAEIPEDFIFNLGPVRFVAELWRVLKPGGRAILVEFGIEAGFSAPVKLPGHTEYEVQYSHLRQVARFLGFQEKFGPLPHFLNMRPDTRVLCTGAAYAIRRFCERSEEHTSELQSRPHLVCRLLLEKKKEEIYHKSDITTTA